VLLNKMMEEALTAANVPQIAPSAIAFKAGLPATEITNAAEIIFPHGYCYRSFRAFPPYLQSFDIAANRKVLLIRDPRDILVSRYFSAKLSHPVPEAGEARSRLLSQRAHASRMTVDAYCLSMIDFVRNEYESYRPLLSTEMRVYRYEDVIFEKERWLADMLSYFEVELPAETIAEIARVNDIRPRKERPMKHIRQVKPGNFRRHLSRRTIETLNRELADILEEFGYS
jgi:hypothetical protein